MCRWIKSVPATSKIIKILFIALYTDKKILHFNGDSSNALFNCNGVGILNIDLNKINLDDTNYEQDDLDTIIHVRLLACILSLKNAKN